MKTVLAIAGSDSISGAGIQADIKTISAYELYATSVITAVTAQNTMSVAGIHAIPADFVKLQAETVLSDIIPDAVKIGMLMDNDIVNAAADIIEQHSLLNIVTDTVMISTSGKRLLEKQACKTLIDRIFSVSDVVTPNIPEAEAITGIKILRRKDMEDAAKAIKAKGCRGAVLIKGGHISGNPADLLYHESSAFWFEEERINNPNTHGTGCTLSSAIASGLAQGWDVLESVKKAKAYITGTIAYGLNLGNGIGPMWHFYNNK